MQVRTGMHVHTPLQTHMSACMHAAGVGVAAADADDGHEAAVQGIPSAEVQGGGARTQGQVGVTMEAWAALVHGLGRRYKPSSA